jgi:hypothetical protein
VKQEGFPLKPIEYICLASTLVVTLFWLPVVHADEPEQVRNRLVVELRKVATLCQELDREAHFLRSYEFGNRCLAPCTLSLAFLLGGGGAARASEVALQLDELPAGNLHQRGLAQALFVRKVWDAIWRLDSLDALVVKALGVLTPEDLKLARKAKLMERIKLVSDSIGAVRGMVRTLESAPCPDP